MDYPVFILIHGIDLGIASQKTPAMTNERGGNSMHAADLSRHKFNNIVPGEDANDLMILLY